jgi:hypothetical protein
MIFREGAIKVERWKDPHGIEVVVYFNGVQSNDCGNADLQSNIKGLK